MLFEHDENEVPFLPVWLFQGLVYSLPCFVSKQGGTF